MSGLRSSQVAAAAGVNLQTLIAGALRAAIDAGCDDLITCAGEPCCPIPFAGIASSDPH